VTKPVYEDPRLSPKLRAALRIMDQRGDLVELTGPADPSDDAPRGQITVDAAARIAQECEEKLTELYGRLRASGHAYAASSAYEASEAAHNLVQELDDARART
jgi:hypothetical protein